MARRIQRIGTFLVTQVVSGLLTFFAMYGVANIGIVFPVTVVEIMLLYAWVLTLLILPIQAGIQI